jgi:dihydroneopterin aldolase
LIEAVAEQLLNIAAVEKVKLRVRKPYAVADASVGISIERTRQ